MKNVISASRRTDIPAFYMDWFMQSLQNGFFEVAHPYTHKTRRVPASTTAVHTIVFWSKNFGPFIRGGYGGRLQEMGYHLFFNFTLNSPSPCLEPHLPALEERLEQLAYLSRRFDPRAIHWRYDPVCFYRTTAGEVQDNFKDFGRIAQKAAAAGVERCIVSFMDMYPKIKRRLPRGSVADFVPISGREKVEILKDMHRIVQPLGIALQACCEAEALGQAGDGLPVEGCACIPNDLIMSLFGGRVSLGKDTGQRVKKGCGCLKSIDVGSYGRHPCHHGCLYCYANPV